MANVCLETYSIHGQKKLQVLLDPKAEDLSRTENKLVTRLLISDNDVLPSQERKSASALCFGGRGMRQGTSVSRRGYDLKGILMASPQTLSAHIIFALCLEYSGAVSYVGNSYRHLLVDEILRRQTGFFGFLDIVAGWNVESRPRAQA